jgi:hypothetical protein
VFPKRYSRLPGAQREVQEGLITSPAPDGEPVVTVPAVEYPADQCCRLCSSSSAAHAESPSMTMGVLITRCRNPCASSTN